MKHFIVDGNNLIGKSKKLKSLQKKDPQGSRESLLTTVENYFVRKKAKVTLHFDGHRNIPLRSSKIKIIYSGDKPADELIKREIDDSKNRSSIIVVTSDLNLSSYCRTCSCEVIRSEEFLKGIRPESSLTDEEKKIDEINNVETFKKIFGV